ncbi:Thiosulfate sulfurtransferase [Saliniradius amylolyticus]|uniref:Thiosulfate sulfurtransferase GlpE n=1 Tax=Saliniradius amylolyticus TaxID=2183582 RepID=A0A2S2DZ43_9ALTE|nr:thiosulfate sulfurtransferase GlpE [Saliniradius amylolyticus]AWL10552.1 Thiosulfate sulfurtransferase [Saliniradius amylolyticus]
MTFKHISAADAQPKLTAGEAVLVDIRDPQSFSQGHIEGAVHLTNDTVARFLAGQPPEQPVIVCCYHGISSQQAAEYLSQQGLKEVYSLDGGFEGWRLAFPFVSADD